jgi:hypothetical protein
MTQEELEKNKFASQRVITVADELLRNLEVNDKTIAERRVTATATSKLSNDFVSVLGQILAETRAPDVDDPRAHLENLAGIIVSVMKQIEEGIRISSDEVLQLEATQEGMRRALRAVRESGALQQRELEKIEELSELENPEARRKIGEHPETMAVKRNAASLKKSRDSSNI